MKTAEFESLTLHDTKLNRRAVFDVELAFVPSTVWIGNTRCQYILYLDGFSNMTTQKTIDFKCWKIYIFLDGLELRKYWFFSPAMNHKLHLQEILESEWAEPHFEERNTAEICLRSINTYPAKWSAWEAMKLRICTTYHLRFHFWRAWYRQILGRTLNNFEKAWQYYCSKEIHCRHQR